MKYSRRLPFIRLNNPNLKENATLIQDIYPWHLESIFKNLILTRNYHYIKRVNVIVYRFLFDLCVFLVVSCGF